MISLVISLMSRHIEKRDGLLRDLLSACDNNDKNMVSTLLNKISSLGRMLPPNIGRMLPPNVCQHAFESCIRHDNVPILKLLLLHTTTQNKIAIDVVIGAHMLMFRSMMRTKTYDSYFEKSLDCFEYLVSITTDVDHMRTQYDANTFTLLHACSIDNEVAVKILLKYGANANNVSEGGDNALHVITNTHLYFFLGENWWPRTIQMLLLAGIDAYAKNSDGKMPGESTSKTCYLGNAARKFAENCY